VLVGSNTVISLIRHWVRPEIRITVFIIIIAAFVTTVELVVEAWFYEIHKVLGIFIPLIVVNCQILGRAEAFAQKQNVLSSLFDALGMGLGFTLALILISGIREFIGAGKLLGFILFKGFEPVAVLGMPSGALLVIGLLLSFFNLLRSKKTCK